MGRFLQADVHVPSVAALIQSIQDAPEIGKRPDELDVEILPYPEAQLGHNGAIIGPGAQQVQRVEMEAVEYFDDLEEGDLLDENLEDENDVAVMGYFTDNEDE